MIGYPDGDVGADRLPDADVLVLAGGDLFGRPGSELLEGLDQVGDLERLVEVAGVVLGKGGKLEMLVAEPGDHENGEVGMLYLDHLEDLQPVDIGHEDIGHEVVVFNPLLLGGIELVYCGDAVGTRDRAVAFLCESYRKITPDFCLIVDDQYASLHESLLRDSGFDKYVRRAAALFPYPPAPHPVEQYTPRTSLSNKFGISEKGVEKAPRVVGSERSIYLNQSRLGIPTPSCQT